jgi:F-type H+-transporting ATPase subunit a
MEHEVWFAKLLNDLLGGVAQPLLARLHIEGFGPGRPFTNYLAMEILVALIIMVLFTLLRSLLSMDKPGGLQHFFELFHDFVKGQAREQVGAHGEDFVPVVMTIAVFILFCNLIGLIPGMEAPTEFIQVTLGCAMFAFLYYNIEGVRAMGLLKYLWHFTGPVWWLAPIMLPIELFSHLARNMSLSVRLYANMFAGEQVTTVFLHLVPIGIPIIFMGLHIFVAFLQTYIFMLLTLIYLGGAAHTEEHGEEHAEPAHAH